jgi:hypothetical protein
MKRSGGDVRIKVILLVLLLLGMAAIFAVQETPDSLAEGGYRLTLGTTAPGGTAVGGSYTMHVSVGQAEAGIQTGGDYGLGGGFWGGGPLTEASPISNLFLPVLIR